MISRPCRPPVRSSDGRQRRRHALLRMRQADHQLAGRDQQQRHDRRGAIGQPPQRDHEDVGGADPVEHLEDEPPVAHHGERDPELEGGDDDAAHEDVAIDRGGPVAARLLARHGEGQAGAGQKEERRRAEVRDPAGEELRGRQRRARVPHEGGVGEQPAGVEGVRAVVDGHQHHDQAAHPVERDQARGGAGLHGVATAGVVMTASRLVLGRGRR